MTFEFRNSLTQEQYEAGRAAQVAARQAAQPEPTWGQVGQGARRNDDDHGPLDPSRFSDHRYWLEHKDEVFAAAARLELPGQTEPFTTTTTTDND